MAKLDDRKAAGADQTLNGIKKYGGEKMFTLMVTLYSFIRKKEYAPRRWRKGVVVNLFLKERR